MHLWPMFSELACASMAYVSTVWLKHPWFIFIKALQVTKTHPLTYYQKTVQRSFCSLFILKLRDFFRLTFLKTGWSSRRSSFTDPL